MAKVEGVDKVLNRLKAKENKLGKSVSVVVGFSTVYALYVHENLEAHHPVGQAKFLEQPAREMRNEIVETATAAMKEGVATLEEGLILGGLILQREAQLRCPVDTGFLKGSAFTRKE